MTTTNVYNPSCYEPTAENKKIYAGILKYIQQLKPASVLEVGSGIGMLGDEIAKLGIRYVGIEPDDMQRKLCHERYPQLNVLTGSCYDDPEKYALGQFDLVFSTDVIEHLYLPKQLISFKKAHLKADGNLLTCTPDFGNYWKNILYSLTGKWDLVHSPHWDGGHIKFFSRKSLEKMLSEQGFVDFEWDTVTNVNIPILPMSIICVARLAK